MCHVFREQFYCSWIHTKTERNRSQPFKETTYVLNFYVNYLPISAMTCRLDFPCFVGVNFRAFNILPGQFFFSKTIGAPKEEIGSGILL